MISPISLFDKYVYLKALLQFPFSYFFTNKGFCCKLLKKLSEAALYWVISTATQGFSNDDLVRKKPMAYLLYMHLGSRVDP